MSSIQTYFESDFNTLPKDWEESLMVELKLSEVGNRNSKKLLGGKSWPTLSFESIHEVQLSASESWKKAATTYAYLADNKIEKMINDDFINGVRNFFFHEQALSEIKWKKIEQVLNRFSNPEELEVFILGEAKYNSSQFNVRSEIISGKFAHDQGGNSVQELAFLCKNLIESDLQNPTIGVYVDSMFFQNIAKLRAARLLAQKIFELTKRGYDFKIAALTSYRGWTLFESYSNLLRNETSVASGYIGCADYIQSSNYNVLFQLETESAENDELLQKSQRLARNTSHILGLESMLGIVEDASFGSYHLENLTNMLCEESWELLQKLLRGEDLNNEILKIREERLEKIKTRKTILSGINDFPNADEELKVQLKEVSFFREARVFEELRLKMNEFTKPKVYISLYGDYATLNSRLNFAKNYFELLGLQVEESGKNQLDLDVFKKDLESRKEEIVILCAQDDHYPLLNESFLKLNKPFKYLAGKFEIPGIKNIFAGQNIFDVLSELVNSIEQRGAK